MGVPTFYRWLTAKYPQVVRDALEEYSEHTPVDPTGPSPSNLEIDNFYIDMNGVVHPCAHPEGGEPPKDESEMFQNVCDYIDRLVAIARPRRLLFLCLDGVAPRAKMNQQRSRRFRAAQDAAKVELVWEQVGESWRERGLTPPSPTVTWDSNVITPGTDFMDRLANVLRFYVAQRMAESTYWRSLTVLISDSNVPGEGEHKIMALVREMRGKISPNTVHCIHGMDADLIMLGLSLHEPHFYIMREAVTDRRDSRKSVQVSASSGSIKTNAAFRSGWKPMQFLQLPVLREYLAHEFTFPGDAMASQDPHTGVIVQPVSDLERHIDDFIFMCFFVGNDFLPHLPSLSLHQGSIDMMMILYKFIFPKLCRQSPDPYLTTADGFVNVRNVEAFSEYLAKAEPAIFQDDVLRKEQEGRRAAANAAGANRKRPLSEVSIVVDRPAKKALRTLDSFTERTSEFSGDSNPVLPPPLAAPSDADFAVSVKSEITKLADDYFAGQAEGKGLGEGAVEDYRARYYMSKFGVTLDEVEAIAAQTAHQYVRGMQWVLLCYRKGVPSWSWFYPYHFAPLAMDLSRYGFANVPRGRPQISPFTLGEPIKPLQQLMSVLPPRSATFLPPSYRQLMTDPKSPLIDCYPLEFRSDCNGKKQSWQWVAMLPFIDLSRLLYWTNKREPELRDDERRRNRRGHEYLFVSEGSSFYESIKMNDATSVLQTNLASECGSDFPIKVLHSTLCGEIGPFPSEGPHTPIPINDKKLCFVNEAGFQQFELQCKIFKFKRPQMTNTEAKLLAGAKPPPPVLTSSELAALDNAQHRGRGPFNVNVATRIILSVIGGKPYREYLNRQNELRAQQDAMRMNAASVIDITNVPKPPNGYPDKRRVADNEKGYANSSTGQQQGRRLSNDGNLGRYYQSTNSARDQCRQPEPSSSRYDSRDDRAAPRNQGRADPPWRNDRAPESPKHGPRSGNVFEQHHVGSGGRGRGRR